MASCSARRYSFRSRSARTSRRSWCRQRTWSGHWGGEVSLGPGPSGLAAAIELARHDIPVTVHEQHAQVGGRFHGDFQGFENWTTEEDVLCWLARLGISLACPYRALNELTLVDPALRPWRVRSERRLLYLVKRGLEAGSTKASGLRPRRWACGCASRTAFDRRS